MKDTITVKKSEITNFVEEGGKFLFKPEAEEHLLKLLEMKELVDKAIDEVKLNIEKAGKEISPDFKGVVGGRIRAIYRVFGEKYTYDKNNPEVASEFLNEFTVRKVISKDVDEHVKETGKLPEGIFEKDRAPKISLTVKKPQIES